MARVKEEADNANEAHYLHYGAYVVELETAKVMEELSEPNRGYALAFKKHLELIGDKPRTVGKRLHELRYILKALNKDARKCTRADIEEFILAMNKSKYAPITRKKTKQTLKKFFKQLYGRDSYPKIVKWVVGDHIENFKLPEDMLTEDDVKALINACLNPRDRCMIALLFDGGIRAGEFLRLKIKDLVFSKDNVCYITIKKGKNDAERRVPLVFSVPYLTTYVNEMRANAQQEDPLFVKFDCHRNITNKAFDYPDLRKLLGDLRHRAQLKKHFTAHTFRHSRASFYANKLTESQLKAFFGWSGGSRMVATYVHLSGRDVDNAVLLANGIINEKGERTMPKLVSRICLKCGKTCEATATICQNCNTPLDIDPSKQFNELQEVKKELGLLKSFINYVSSKDDKMKEYLERSAGEMEL